MNKPNTDLEKYAREGWRAKRKKVNNREYVVLRRRGKDKSLGPYAEELWQKCIQLGMVKKKPENVEGLKRTVEELSQQLSATSMLLKEQEKKFEKLRKTSEKDHHAVLSFQKRLKKMENNITLQNLYDNYKCSNCGSKGLVAVNIYCTKCNTPTAWGRYPKK